MKTRWIVAPGFWAIAMATAFFPGVSWAHVTLQSSQPLKLKGIATVTLNVPNERYVDNTKVTLEVPEAFLKAGGRLSRVIYPAGWTVTLEKQDKPSEVLSQEKESRGKRDAKKDQSPDHGSSADAKADAKAGDDKQEKKAMDEMRKKWITKVTFEGGAIPPDGFQQFQISFQLPDEPGKYRFAAVQTYADGKDVSWSELVEGAEHPAPTLNLAKPPLVSYSDLPVPLAALALLVAVVGYFKKGRVPAEAGAPESLPMRGALASAGGGSAG